MEFEKARTPLKLYSTMQMSGMLAHKVSNENVELITTPGGSRCQKKILHPRTPSKTINCSMSTTISSMSSSSSKQISSSTAITPPAKRFHRIRNPFEPVLADRLHLPLIARLVNFLRNFHYFAFIRCYFIQSFIVSTAHDAATIIYTV